MIRWRRRASRGRPGSRASPDARPLREAVDLAVEDLAERPADDALRLERSGRSHAGRGRARRGGTVRSSNRPWACSRWLLEHERVDLLLQEADVGSEREDVLDRAVVEVEAEAHQATLGGRDERAVALALDCSSRCSRSTTGPIEVAASARNASATSVSTDPPRPTSAAYGSPKRRTGAARSSTLRGGRGETCRGARPSPRRVPAGSGRPRSPPRAGIPAVDGPAPDRDLGQHVEAEEEPELDLEREERWELEESRVADRLVKNRVYRAAGSGSAQVSATAAAAPRTSSSSSSSAAASSTIASAA